MLVRKLNHSCMNKSSLTHILEDFLRLWGRSVFFTLGLDKSRGRFQRKAVNLPILENSEKRKTNGDLFKNLSALSEDGSSRKKRGNPIPRRFCSTITLYGQMGCSASWRRHVSLFELVVKSLGEMDSSTPPQTVPGKSLELVMHFKDTLTPIFTHKFSFSSWQKWQQDLPFVSALSRSKGKRNLSLWKLSLK